MARGVNKVILIGNLGDDPRLIDANGTNVVNASLATNESWKDKSTGEQVEKTEWHRLVAFNRLAEIMDEYLRKGSKIYVEGKLQTRQFTDKDGNERWTTEVVVLDMQMLDSRGEGGSSNSSRSKPAQKASSLDDVDDEVDVDDDDDWEWEDD